MCPIGTSPEVVELVVKLAPDAAIGGARHDALIAAMNQLDVHFEPEDQHGFSAAAGGYSAAIVPREVAERALAQILHLDGVDAAYIKSRGEPPSGGNP